MAQKEEKKQAVDSKTLLKLDEWKKYLRKWIQPKKKRQTETNKGADLNREKDVH